MRYGLVLLTFLLFFSVMAQKRIKFYDLQWPKRDLSLLMPDEFQEEDAVIIERRQRWDLSKREALSNSDFLQFYYRIRFLTYEGVEQYGYGIIPIIPGAQIRRVDLRISHPDGSTFDLRAKSLKKFIHPKGTEEFPLEDFILIKVPVLLPGDELEIFFEYDGVPLAPRSFFHDFLPIVHSEIIISHDDYEPIIYAQYNGLPEPLRTEELHVVDLQWSRENVEIVNPNIHSVPENYLPHISHSYQPAFFEERDMKLIWSSYARQTAQVQYRFEKTYDKQLETWLAETWSGIPFEDKWNRILVIHECINREVSVHNDRSRRVNIGYALHNRSIYYDDLILFYVDLFDRLEVPYSIGLGRDFRTGELDSSFHSLTQITHYGFRWPTTHRNYAFVFPKHPRARFTFNQMPFELQGTDMLLLQIDKPFKVELVNIPDGQAESNLIYADIQVRDPQSKILSTQFELSGEWPRYLIDGSEARFIFPPEFKTYSGTNWGYAWDRMQRISEEVLLLAADLDRSVYTADERQIWDVRDIFPILPIGIDPSFDHDLYLHIPHIQKLRLDISEDISVSELPVDSELVVEGIGTFRIYSIQEGSSQDWTIFVELELEKRHYQREELSELANLLNFATESRKIRFPQDP